MQNDIISDCLSWTRLCQECQTLIENHDQIKLLSNARNNLNTTLKVKIVTYLLNARTSLIVLACASLCRIWTYFFIVKLSARFLDSANTLILICCLTRQDSKVLWTEGALDWHGIMLRLLNLFKQIWLP